MVCHSRAARRVRDCARVGTGNCDRCSKQYHPVDHGCRIVELAALGIFWDDWRGGAGVGACTDRTLNGRPVESGIRRNGACNPYHYGGAGPAAPVVVSLKLSAISLKKDEN